MKHHYTIRKFDNNLRPYQGRATCTKTYLPWESGDNWTSVPNKATCTACLKVLIPVLEMKLAEMKRNLERSEATLQ